jgi:hypothetical protein
MSRSLSMSRHTTIALASVALIAASLACDAGDGGPVSVVIGRAAAAPPPQHANSNNQRVSPGRAVSQRSAVEAVAASRRGVQLRGVPFLRQKPDFSGEACAAMALRKLGLSGATQDRLFALTRVDPAHGRGAGALELAAALQRAGLEPGRAIYRVNRRRPGPALGAQFQALHRDLRAGFPSIVGTRQARGRRPHFMLVLGYDGGADQLIVHDPGRADGAGRKIGRRELLALMPLPRRRGQTAAVRLRLKPGAAVALPALQRRGRFSRADFARHVMALRRTTLPRLRGRFNVRIQPPFVLVGDSGRGDLRKLGLALVKRATDSFKELYFDKDPVRILDIYLFKGRKSYTVNAVRLTGQQPGTPFGFYSSSHNALVMNIKTGGGTLVHELVHPFVEANFPNCPPWFNEGLGSLYEGVGWPGGKIRGYTNWRLPGLKQAIKRGRVPNFKALMAQNEYRFYQRDPGTNYSQSRYLLYYLQQKKLLRTYYHAFYKNRRTDPTGYQTLLQLLKLREDQMPAFKQQWEAYTMRLRWR